MPPPLAAKSLLNVLPLTVLLPWLLMPPPRPPLAEAELPVKVLPLTVSVPVLSMPPPLPLLAELPVKVLVGDRQRATVVDAAAAAEGGRSCR